MASLDEVLARQALLEEKLETAAANYEEALDTIWMLFASCLVFFMHAGFSLLEAGIVRGKSTQNILTKNMVVCTVAFLAWFALGWPLAFGSAFGDSPDKFFSMPGQFNMQGFSASKNLFRKWFFNGALCATSSTIVSGAMAERTQLCAFVAYTLLTTSLIYPMLVYWTWSGQGFLSYEEAGKRVSVVGPAVLDFAGSGVVHLTGGIGALCGAVLVGVRKGRFAIHVEQAEFDGHCVPFSVIGTLCLWFSWYGFNPGSTMSMHDKDSAFTAGLVAVNTTLAPCASGLVVFFLRAKVVPPKLLDIVGFCNGVLAGLVAITASCAYVQCWEAIFIGCMAGVIYQAVSMILVRLRIDDVVDAFSVHGAGGLWGIIAAGLFGDPATGFGGNGALYGGDQLRTQLFAATVIVLWVGGLSTLALLVLKKAKCLRLASEKEEQGCDATDHSPVSAYGLEKHLVVVPTGTPTQMMPTKPQPVEDHFPTPPHCTWCTDVVVGELEGTDDELAGLP
eukprot:TRINITY_DN9699_c0_g2_i1.p1 TRINITY_DN9699_c0_g2~~TRINITY_DN9699_c0_g2_i1.p1  ORF type:complete len:505 (-),score=93.78 TRINITY_DN9699_c0_g2_i1:74-1588(-)